MYEPPSPEGPGSAPRAAGSCLCGAVTYRVHGPLRDVFLCHCSVCRRTHGHLAAYTACSRDALEIDSDDALRWHEHDGARRGFCRLCGSRLFWERPDRSTISIAAGSVHEPTGLRVAEEWHTESAGDYYDV
jgi:hypothetical protein